jgi:hypothetical protein
MHLTQVLSQTQKEPLPLEVLNHYLKGQINYPAEPGCFLYNTTQ